MNCGLSAITLIERKGKTMFIDKNTISTIRKTENGFVLTMYKNTVPYFEKAYKTFSAAKQVETKKIKKHFDR